MKNSNKDQLDNRDKTSKKVSFIKQVFSNNGKLTVGIMIGIIIGWLGVPYLSSFILDNHKSSLSFIVGALSFAIILYVIIIWNIKKIQKLLFDQELNLSDLKSDLHEFSNNVLTNLIDDFYPEKSKISKTAFKKLSPKLGNYFIWSFLRGWGYRQLIALFGILLTFLTIVVALQQNKLVEVQNKLVDGQNKLIEQDIILNDANTKSSYVSLIDNLFEQINDARKDSAFYAKNVDNLFYKIILLNSRLKPYRYFKNGKLIEKELSPERGLLLTYLIHEKYLPNNETYNITFLRALFQRAPNWQNSDLDGVDFLNRTLYRIDLSGSSLRNSNLSNVNLRGVNLSNCDLRNSVLYNNSTLIGANFKGANLEGMMVSEDWFQIMKKSNITGFDEIFQNYKMIPNDSKEHSWKVKFKLKKK